MPSPSDLRTLRLSLGLTQQQAGELVGGSRRTWQNWEAGLWVMPSAKWELFQLKTASQQLSK